MARASSYGVALNQLLKAVGDAMGIRAPRPARARRAKSRRIAKAEAVAPELVDPLPTPPEVAGAISPVFITRATVSPSIDARATPPVLRPASEWVDGRVMPAAIAPRPTPPDAGSYPLIVVGGVARISRRQCKELEPATGRQCGLLENHTGEHCTARGPFVRTKPRTDLDAAAWGST